MKHTFYQMIEFCRTKILKYFDIDILPELFPLMREWLGLQNLSFARKKANDLKVLYLCGPNPMNDLSEMLKLGISQYNVWALESDAKAYESAKQALLKSEGSNVKLRLSTLHEFFKVVPQQFDIVYFDACGPLFGGKPNTIETVYELFMNQRLAPLSVLITNFSEAGLDNAPWSERIASWFCAKSEQPVWEFDESERISNKYAYAAFVKKNLKDFYSEFITSFIIELASLLIPYWRIAALEGARGEYFADKETLKRAKKDSRGNKLKEINLDNFDYSEFLIAAGHPQLAPTSYPYLWSTRVVDDFIVDNSRFKDDPYFDLFTKKKVNEVALKDAIEAISLIKKFFEANIAWASHNKEACSPALSQILERFDWFDFEFTGKYGPALFCDIPLPNLIVDLLVGIYGYPYHNNSKNLLRVKYTAKTTPMYTDVFIFDQSRYLYDFVPSIPLFVSNMNRPRQIISRVCMDAIARHSFYDYSDLFKGSFLACLGEGGFSTYPWKDRELII
jgi:hypothetical protein